MTSTRSVIKTLERLKVSDLRQLAQENGLRVHSKMTRKAIIQALLRPGTLSHKLYGGARTESSSVTDSPDPSPVPPVPPVAWDKIPEPALLNIIKRLSRNDFNRFRRTSRTFNDRIKKLETQENTKDFYQALIANLSYSYVPIELEASSPVSSLAWSTPAGAKPASRLASGGVDGIIRIWGYDPETGIFQQNPLELRGHPNSVNSLAWSPDGSRLASGGMDRIIRIWGIDPETGTFQQNPLELSDQTSPVFSLAWSPDGTRLASGGADRIVRIWEFDPNTGTFQQNPLELRGHTEAVWSLAWSPDGTRLASGGWDEIIRIWGIDPETGTFQQNPLELMGYTDWVNSLAWSPDGTRLASGGNDGIIRIWGFDPNTGTFQQNPLELRGHTDSVRSLAWSPDDNDGGSRLASGGDDRIIRIWMS